MKKILFFIAFLISSLHVFAGDTSRNITTPAPAIIADTNASIQMADGLYQSGKIYVVVLVILLIFASLFFYLFYIDRKLTHLEKQILDKK